MRLSHNFPLSDTVSPEPNLPLREYIRSNLPPREEADYLWEQARHNALWQYNPHPNSTFYPNLAYHCYSASTPSLSSRRLALLYMILAVGCLVDLPNREPDHPDAEKYHQLARASLCEIPVMEDTNVETITALFYEIWFLLVFSDKKKAAGYAWGLMGLTAKLAQSVSGMSPAPRYAKLMGYLVRLVYVRHQTLLCKKESSDDVIRSKWWQIKGHPRGSRKAAVLVLGAPLPRCSPCTKTAFGFPSSC